MTIFGQNKRLRDWIWETKLSTWNPHSSRCILKTLTKPRTNCPWKLMLARDWTSWRVAHEDRRLSVISETLKNARHLDITLTYSRRTSRVSILVPEGETCTLKKDSPCVVLGVGEIASRYHINGSHTFPNAVDISKGRRLAWLYTVLIGPA